MSLLEDNLKCAGCGDCLADPRVSTGEQCVKIRQCDCHTLSFRITNATEVRITLENHAAGIGDVHVNQESMEFVDQDGVTWIPTQDQQRAIRQAEKNANEEKLK